ncbi:hypothetical protein ACOI1H_24475, partial [Loktanella sp. DJP18]|uniref:hypothetical protein n=1 Tax=Loktanella sp. DJP18 TaxID=3409788 RepID=UPI003BB6E3EF
GPLTELPMKPISQGEKGIFAWTLMDGTVLTLRKQQNTKLKAWRRGDDGLSQILIEAGVPLSRVMIIAS